MTSWLILLVKQFIDIYKYLVIKNALFEINDSNQIKTIINFKIIIIVFIIYLIFYSQIVEVWINLNLLLCLLSIILTCKTTIIKTIKIICMTVLVNTILEQFVDVFIKYDPIDIYSLKFVLVNCINFILTIIIALIIKTFNNKKCNFIDMSWYIYMNIIFGFSATIFPLFITIIYGDIISSRVGVIITFVAYTNIVISLISIRLYIKNEQEKNLYYLESIMKDKTLKLQERYYQKLIENYSSIRKFKHDIKGHIKLITGLLNEGKYDKAAIYLDEMSENISNKNNYSTNNIYISTILNSFDQTFKENNITFELSYYITRNLNMNSMDICSLFYNLLTNAVEANLKLDEDRYIKLFIADIKDNMIIKIVNPVETDFDLSFINENRTSKQDKENHGFGLITINDIVDKYYGGIDYSVSSGALSIDITLLNVLCD